MNSPPFQEIFIIIFFILGLSVFVNYYSYFSSTDE